LEPKEFLNLKERKNTKTLQSKLKFEIYLAFLKEIKRLFDLRVLGWRVESFVSV